MTAHTSQTLELDKETLSRELNEIDRLLHRIRDRVGIFSLPPRVQSAEEIRKIFKRTGGILKNKITEDLVEWQRKVRAEWN